MTPQQPKPCKSARLLVVDDEPLNRDLMRRVLHAEYSVDDASDVPEALVLLEQQTYEVILCDQLMPGRSGSELAKEVSDRWPGTVFMLITGYDDDPLVLEAQREGLVQFVVPKPWSARGLKELVKSALPAGG